MDRHFVKWYNEQKRKMWGGVSMKEKKKLIFVIIVLFILLSAMLWFTYRWGKQQDIANKYMCQLAETITIVESEELSEEEIKHLFASYQDEEQMASFRKERETVFMERTRAIRNLQIVESVLTEQKDASSGKRYIQLCFYGNLDEKISDSLFYAYRYFEDGKMGKVICYAYDTAKTKLLNESGTGMTMKYNNTTKRLQVDDVTMYDDGLYDVIHQLGMKSF